MAHQTQAEGSYHRPQHTARPGMQDARGHHNDERRPDCKRKRADANRRHRDHCNRARRAHRVHQRTPRHLASERHQSACGQHQPDIQLCPGLRGQVNGDERTETGLDVGKEKGEPVKAARARARRRIVHYGRGVLRCRR